MSKSDRRKWRRVDFNDLPSEGKILFNFFFPSGQGQGAFGAPQHMNATAPPGFPGEVSMCLCNQQRSCTGHICS